MKAALYGHHLFAGAWTNPSPWSIYYLIFILIFSGVYKKCNTQGYLKFLQDWQHWSSACVEKQGARRERRRSVLLRLPSMRVDAIIHSFLPYFSKLNPLIWNPPTAFNSAREVSIIYTRLSYYNVKTLLIDLV